MPLAFLALIVAVLAFCGLPTLVLLIAAGVLWMLFRQGTGLARKAGNLGNASLLLGFVFGGAAPSVVATFLYFLKIGAVLFGSGYVLLAVLHTDLVVRLHWLTNAQLLDAIAVSQATPGPFFTVATFIGYLLAGWRGATLATVGMFLPAFVYVAITARFLPQIRKSPFAAAFLDGVNAAAVALMAFVGWQFARGSLTNIPAILICAISLLLVLRYKVNSAWMVAGGAITGILLQLLHRA